MSQNVENGKVPSGRLASLDALRGFDMFWIMGGFELLAALGGVLGFANAAEALDHAPWHGLHFMDLVFPLFLFLAGVSFVFSAAKSRERGLSDGAIALRALRRGAILFALGVLYGDILTVGLAHFRVWSVLGRIGVAWTVAAWLYLAFGTKARLWIAAAILAAVTVFTVFVVAPGAPVGADPFSREWNFGSWMDRTFTTNHNVYWMSDPEGFSGLLPSVVTAMLGMFAGEIVRAGGAAATARKALRLLLAGVACGALGAAVSCVFPINKALWSPSFVLVVGGISFALFALFYWTVDVRGWTGWAFALRVIGLNSITIYLLTHFVDFKRTSQMLFGGCAAAVPAVWGPVVLWSGYSVICWLILYFLYRHKAFLKV